jgi:DNA-binding beta-propeller fold protein YncE
MLVAASSACGGSAHDAGVAERTASESPGVTKTEAGGVERTAESPGVTKMEAGRGPCCLVVQDGAVWVMNHRDRSIQRIDPQTNTLDEPVNVYPFDKMISVGDNLLLESETSVAAFDPETSKLLQPVPIRGEVRGLAFDPRTSTAWVGSGRWGTHAGRC